jgi:hypothetical protein
MKHLQMLGLVAGATMSILLFAGSGTASATVLCKVTGSPCPAGQDYPAGTALHAVQSKPAFIDEIYDLTEKELSFECPQQTITGKTENTGGATQTVSMSISELKWLECPRQFQMPVLGALEIHYTSAGNGTVTLKNFKYTTVINGAYHCTYEAGSGIHFGTLTGGSEAAIAVNASVPRTSGNIIVCPSEIRWTANFTITTPKPLYLAAS